MVTSVTHSAALYYMKDMAMSDPDIKRFFTRIGKQLRTLRECRKISAEKFAKEIGITIGQLDKIEAGEVWVEPEFYQKAAKICGMNTRVFIDAISAYELPDALVRHRDLILDSLTDLERNNYKQYHAECIEAARQTIIPEERKLA